MPTPPSRIVLLLALALSLVFGGTRVTVQSGTPTILLVVSASAPNPFGRYLEEVLKVEGLNAVTTVDVNSVTAGLLASARLVVLAEMPLTPGQAQLFVEHVIGGGRLVAMRPDSQLAATLGIIPAGTSQANGYLAINQAHPLPAPAWPPSPCPLPASPTTTRRSPGPARSPPSTTRSPRPRRTRR